MKPFISMIFAGKLFHAAGPGMAKGHSLYRVFDVPFGYTSLPAVDAKVKVEIDDDCSMD